MALPQFPKGAVRYEPPYLAVARDQLDPAAWAQSFAEGRAMSIQQAIAEVIEESAAEQHQTSPAPRPALRAASQSVMHAESPGGLTSREIEVLVLVAQGLRNQDVAHRLIISRHTVKRHLDNIYAKLNVCSRHEAIRWAQDVRLCN
jgi:ATP/maltotriose-dependent transcriptional regulator MalT